MVELDETEMNSIKLRLGGLWDILKTPNFYWHATTIERFREIYSFGIQPSDGKIKSDYPNSLGSYFRSVCLFNFFGVSEKLAFGFEDCWGCFLVGDNSAKVFIEIKAEYLKSDYLIHQKHNTYVSLQESNDSAKYKNHIPHVENWYTQPILKEVIQKIIIIKHFERPFEYKILYNSDNLLEKIERINIEWLSLEKVKREENRKSRKFPHLIF